MVVTNQKSARIVVKPEFFASWELPLERTGLSQQEAFDRMLRFLLLHDEVTQAMILGTLPARKDLIGFALQRLSTVTGKGVIKQSTKPNQ